MNEVFSTALTLLVIGMITVSLVLLLVVLTGNFLIWLTNRLATNDAPDKSDSGDISNKQIAVLSAAVNTITSGRGRITKIEKS